MTTNNSKRTIINDISEMDDLEEEVEAFNIGKGIKLPSSKGKNNGNVRAKSSTKGSK